MITSLNSPPFPVETPFFRGYMDRDKTVPIPAMLFQRQPIPLTSEPYNAVPGDDEFYDTYNSFPGFIDHIKSISSNQHDPLTAWELLRPMQIFDTDISCIEVIAETIRLGLQSMLNELENAPEAKQYFREKIIEAIS